jgi:hypothetical protein
MAFTNWDGNIVDIGPIYPWVGLEAVMVIAAFVFWIGWHVVQLREENRRFEDEARALRKSGDLQRLMQAEDFD